MRDSIMVPNRFPSVDLQMRHIPQREGVNVNWSSHHELYFWSAIPLSSREVWNSGRLPLGKRQTRLSSHSINRMAATGSRFLQKQNYRAVL